MKKDENLEVVESTTEEKGALVVPKMQEINYDFFGESKTKRITTLDLNNPEDADMLLNANQQADYKLNDEIEKEIKCIGCILSETPSETVNEETGEVITRKKHTVLLFDEKGCSHATGSNSCYMSFCQIIKLKGLPTRDNPIVVIPIKAPAKEKGHEYLRLKVKTNK